MAKKKNLKKSKKNKRTEPIFENVLPQNILQVGERVEQNKKIYISQPVYKEIHKFTKNKTTNESGGMLVGTVIEEFGNTNIIINGFVEAKYCEGTPTTLTFTHETWDYVHKEIDKKFPGQKIVGWIHTHPNFGIFLSEYDKFIQENFFREEYQIAYVVDPIQHIEGFYFWINGNIEKCNGFYKFDKMGETIEEEVVEEEKDEEEEKDNKKKKSTLKNIIIAILAISVVLLAMANNSQTKEIKALKQQQQSIMLVIEQYLGFYGQNISDLETRIEKLEKKHGIKQKKQESVVVVEPEQETTTVAETTTEATTTTSVSSFTPNETIAKTMGVN